MKNKITPIALIIILFISSVSVFAGERNKLKQRTVNATTLLNQISVENAEVEMEMENWMKSFKSFTNAGDEGYDKEMFLENWMLKDFVIYTAEITDQEANFEHWMLKPFNTNNSEKFTTEELQFESWMLKF